MMILWILRLLVFDLYACPKNFMGRGRSEGTVRITHIAAAYYCRAPQMPSQVGNGSLMEGGQDECVGGSCCEENTADV